MRTTLTLDDHLFRTAKQRAAAAGITLGEFVNRALADAVRPKPAVPSEPFHVITYGSGRDKHYEPADFKAIEEEEDRIKYGGG